MTKLCMHIHSRCIMNEALPILVAPPPVGLVKNSCLFYYVFYVPLLGRMPPLVHPTEPTLLS